MEAVQCHSYLLYRNWR